MAAPPILKASILLSLEVFAACANSFSFSSSSSSSNFPAFDYDYQVDDEDELVAASAALCLGCSKSLSKRINSRGPDFCFCQTEVRPFQMSHLPFFIPPN